MSHQLKFQELLDLAFEGGPEPGTINGRYLHGLLSALMEKSAIGHCRVELKGGQFCTVDTMIENKCKPLVHIAEYEAQKNESTGKYDKKKQIREPEEAVTTILVVRDLRERSDEVAVHASVHQPGLAGDYVEKIKELEARIHQVETLLLLPIQKSPEGKTPRERTPDKPKVSDVEEELNQICLEESYRTTTDESPTEESSRPQSASTNSDSFGTVCSETEIVENMRKCILQMCSELAVLKRELCKTQKCVKKLCEDVNVTSTVYEEMDIKFDELTNIINGVMETGKKNCTQLHCIERSIAEVENRVDIAFEEQETLFRVKADQEDVDCKLERKANLELLDLKVNVDVFNCVKSELCDAVLDIHQRIATLSQCIEEQMKEIVECLGRKLNISTFEPFAKCVEDRIRLLGSELQRWIHMKKKEICPFTRQPFVQNQCCGVCSQPVVMRGQQTPLPKMPALSTITWNCNTKALCCRTGGAHTTTTPQDRLCRRGKFMTRFAEANDCAKEKSPDLSMAFSCLGAPLDPKSIE